MNQWNGRFFWFNLHQNSNILFEFVCKKKALTKQPSRFKISTTTPFSISLRHTYCWFSSLNLIELTPSCMIMIVSLTTSILLCWRHEVWGCYHQQVYKRFDKIMSFFMSSSFCWIFAWFTLVSKICSKYNLMSVRLWNFKDGES